MKVGDRRCGGDLAERKDIGLIAWVRNRTQISAHSRVVAALSLGSQYRRLGFLELLYSNSPKRRDCFAIWHISLRSLFPNSLDSRIDSCYNASD
jgi:hypothetical protein